MQPFVIALCTMAFVVLSNGAAMDALMKDGIGCAVELGLPPDSLMKMVESRDPKLNCVSACVMKKTGALDANGINLEKVLNSIPDQVKTDPAKLEAGVKKCIPIGNSGADDCDKAGKFGECLEQEVKLH